MKPWFNVRKASQVSAFFAIENGGSINVLKLVKLVYLADRKFIELYDSPILNDQLVSMDHGPVNSMTLDYINGCNLERDSWEEFMTDRAGYSVGLSNPNVSKDDLDELNVAELKVLESIWAEFGKMTPYEVRDYTHKHCPEWEDPNGSSCPIPYERVFKFLGKENFSELASKIESERAISIIFAGV